MAIKLTYTYTPEGQRLIRLWARGVDTTYTRDPASGDLTLIDYSDSTPDVTFADYDIQSRAHTVTDGLGTRTLSYATGGLLSGDSLTGVSYTYDNGRVSGLSLGSYTVTYGYDAVTGRVESVTYLPGTPDEQISIYGYVPDSHVLGSVSTSSGLTVTRTYEPNRDIITQVKNQFGTDIISQYDSQYDELAQRISMTTSGTAIDTMPQPTIPEQDISYTTNALNQYTSLQSSGSSIQLTYDLDGNLIEDNIHHFTYDTENRLTSVTPITPTASSKKVEYAYDYMGRRTQKKIYTYDGSSWVLETEKSFVYNGWNLMKEQTTAGGPMSTDYYVWGLDLSGILHGPSNSLRTGSGGIGGLLMRKSDTGTFLYLYDANGDVEQLVNAADGSVAARTDLIDKINKAIAQRPQKRETDSDSHIYAKFLFCKARNGL